MAKVSISEAARLSGVSRSHLYAAFIKPGRISVETVQDATGKPVKQIDTSELARVFGSLEVRTEDTQRTGHIRTSVDVLEDMQDNRQDKDIAVLHERVRGLEALLRVTNDTLDGMRVERDRLLGVIESQTRLLEHQDTQGRLQDRHVSPWFKVAVVAMVISAVGAVAVIGWSVWPINSVSVTTPSTSAPDTWRPESGG